MTNGKLLRQLIKYGSEGNVEAFRTISEQIILEERQKQHHSLADELERMLHGRLSQSTHGYGGALAPRVPTDKERGFPLIDLKVPQRDSSTLILDVATNELIQYILLQQYKSDIIKSYGLFPAGKVLFYGPPGCGKTLAAEVMAYELQYHFGVVRLDAVVSSYLGETAANLKSIFDFAQNTPIVLLFDEFDAIARNRDDSSEHGELKRVVNAVLQMMDAFSGDSLLIAATNHQYVLDPAIWRRFEEVVFFDLPNSHQIAKMIGSKIINVKSHINIDEMLYMFDGKSFADVERIINRSIKKMILAGDKILSDSHIIKSLHEEASRLHAVLGRGDGSI